MKSSIIQFAQKISSDRQFITALVLLGVSGVGLALYVAFNVHASELQVVTHYTAFGSTNFYRDKWYYLITFAVFGVLTAVMYTALACKLYTLKGRELAIPFVWLGIITIILAAATVYQVLKVAALS